MALSMMADKLKQSAAKKMKNLSEEEKKVLLKNNGVETEIKTESNPVEKSIEITSTKNAAEPGDDYENTVRKKVDELKNLGLIGVDELYKQLPRLSGDLQSGVGKTDQQLGVVGGTRVRNLASNMTRNIDEIVNMARDKKMKSINELKGAKQYFMSDPSIKAMVGNDFFDQLYPNFWTVVGKKAGITQ